jgi:hypothetical protein
MMAACVCSLLAIPAPARAQGEDHSHHGAPGTAVGTVNFETSCKADVKDGFNHAVAELHSFWFPEARAEFEGVLEKDPDCAMAYWGIALTHWGNPFGGLRSAQAIAAGKAAIEKGQSTGSPTPREKGYIDAVAGLFSSADPATQRARVVAYEGATEVVAAHNPTDTEARIFWALAIAQTALPTDKSFAQNLKAAEILEPLYKKMPNHPGLAHYIIHSYDVPALAERALPAARAYADIAPSVPHARSGEDRRLRRSAACDGLSDLCLPADGAGRAGEAGARSRDQRRGDRRLGARRAVRRRQHLRARGHSGALRNGAPAVERRDDAQRPAGAEHAVHRSDHALRARDRRGSRRPTGGRRR